MTTARPASPPLAGIRVLELATHYAGPGAGMFLADYGAQVVKIELPEGDPGRRLPPLAGDSGISLAFLAYNRGKRSAVIDWRQPAGRDAVDRLLATTDVMVVDAPVGARSETWQFHYHRRLKALFPRLVYAGVSSFGRRGPYVDLPPYDPLVQAASGVIGSSRNRDGLPVHAGFRLGDSAAAMLLANGVMMALLARRKTGLGQRVETSMLEAAVAMQSVQLVWAEQDPTPPSDPAQATVASYRCGDGRYINIITIQERQWQGLCRVLGLDHLIVDPEYGSGAARNERRGELFPLLEGIFGTRPSGEWLPLLQEAGVPCGPTLSRWELFDDPQIVANNLAARASYPGLGAVAMMGSPVKFSESALTIGSTVPSLGQHTTEVLREAGFSEQEMADLAEQGIIH